VFIINNNITIKGVINMNIKKIGLTALAASLVSVSANAAELSVSGGASITANHYSAGADLNYGGSFTMGNAIVFSGSGELDNGMTVSVSYELDEGANSAADSNTEVFDNHSVTVSSDTLGTLIFSGHGGNSAVTAINTTAAGDIFDLFDGQLETDNAATGVAISEAGAGDDSFFYTLPTLMDGLAVNLSYNPANTTDGGEGAYGYGATYTGIDGLTVSMATADKETGTASTSGDTQAISVSYAYGPVTVGYTSNEHNEGAASSANDQDLMSYSVSYTVSENLSVGYGYEEIESGTAADQDAEYTKISASYTSGGVTLSAGFAEAENIDHSTAAKADQDYYYLGASFAF
jgi:outer membrane protein OmpU